MDYRRPSTARVTSRKTMTPAWVNRCPGGWIPDGSRDGDVRFWWTPWDVNPHSTVPRVSLDQVTASTAKSVGDPRRTDIPSQNLSSGGVLGVGAAVLPGGVLVVEGAGLEAAVQDADEPVRELAQRCVVAGVAAAKVVAVGPCTWRGTQRGEGLEVQRGAEAAVGGVAGQDDGFLA